MRVWGLAMLALGTGCAPLEPFDCEQCAPSFEGLTAPVELVRDELGFVHVYGESDADALYGAGYAQARDRLFQMDLMRRQALGRRAEVLGEAGLFGDRLIRMTGVPEWGRAATEATKTEQPENYVLLEAWTAGVNQRIDEVLAGDAPLPYGFGELGYEPERWAITDGFTVGKTILFGNANQIDFEILATILEEYFGEVTAKLPVIAPLLDSYVLPPDERPTVGTMPFSGTVPSSSPGLPADAAARLHRFVKDMEPFRPGASNNWAVDGRHTATGRPLIAGDPHQALRTPSVFWGHHINSADAGGTLDVAGFGFAGTPMVQLGHNRHLAWTATTSYPDVMDLYEVVTDGETVELFGESVPLETRTETIVVAGQDDVELIVEWVPGIGVLLPTDLSPLPITSPGNRLLLRWTGFTATREGPAFLAMDRATTLDEWRAGIDAMEIGNFNFIGASAEGIAYHSRPEVPVRADVSDAEPPYRRVNGANAAHDWTGQLEASALPDSIASDRGWLASANNDPFGFVADGGLEGDAHYFGVFYDPGTRAGRIEQELERLTAEGDITMEAMQDLQMDTYTVLADLLLPVLEEVFAEVPTAEALEPYRDRPELEALYAEIMGWDRQMTQDSAAALSFHAFMWFASAGALRDDLGLLFDTVNAESPIFILKWALLTIQERYDGASDLLQEGRDVIVMEALSQCAAYLETTFGDEGYAWGDVHHTDLRSLYGDALDIASFPSDGADGTVNVAAGAFLDEGEPVDRILTGSGAAYRMVASIGADGTPEATINYPPGNDGEPGSPFFDDQLEGWRQGVYRPLPFLRPEVDGAAVETTVLEP